MGKGSRKGVSKFSHKHHAAGHGTHHHHKLTIHGHHSAGSTPEKDPLVEQPKSQTTTPDDASRDDASRASSRDGGIKKEEEDQQVPTNLQEKFGATAEDGLTATSLDGSGDERLERALAEAARLQEQLLSAKTVGNSSSQLTNEQQQQSPSAQQKQQQHQQRSITAQIPPNVQVPSSDENFSAAPLPHTPSNVFERSSLPEKLDPHAVEDASPLEDEVDAAIRASEEMARALQALGVPSAVAEPVKKETTATTTTTATTATTMSPPPSSEFAVSSPNGAADTLQPAENDAQIKDYTKSPPPFPQPAKRLPSGEDLVAVKDYSSPAGGEMEARLEVSGAGQQKESHSTIPLSPPKASVEATSPGTPATPNDASKEQSVLTPMRSDGNDDNKSTRDEENNENDADSNGHVASPAVEVSPWKIYSMGVSGSGDDQQGQVATDTATGPDNKEVSSGAADSGPGAGEAGNSAGISPKRSELRENLRQMEATFNASKTANTNSQAAQDKQEREQPQLPELEPPPQTEREAPNWLKLATLSGPPGANDSDSNKDTAGDAQDAALSRGTVPGSPHQNGANSNTAGDQDSTSRGIQWEKIEEPKSGDEDSVSLRGLTSEPKSPSTPSSDNAHLGADGSVAGTPQLKWDKLEEPQAGDDDYVPLRGSVSPSISPQRGQPPPPPTPPPQPGRSPVRVQTPQTPSLLKAATSSNKTMSNKLESPAPPPPPPPAPVDPMEAAAAKQLKTPSDVKWEKVDYAEQNDEDYVPLKDYSKTPPTTTTAASSSSTPRGFSPFPFGGGSNNDDAAMAQSRDIKAEGPTAFELKRREKERQKEMKQWAAAALLAVLALGILYLLYTFLFPAPADAPRRPVYKKTTSQHTHHPARHNGHHAEQNSHSSSRHAPPMMSRPVETARQQQPRTMAATTTTTNTASTTPKTTTKPTTHQKQQQSAAEESVKQISRQRQEEHPPPHKSSEQPKAAEQSAEKKQSFVDEPLPLSSVEEEDEQAELTDELLPDEEEDEYNLHQLVPHPNPAYCNLPHAILVSKECRRDVCDLPFAHFFFRKCRNFERPERLKRMKEIESLIHELQQ